MMIKYPKFLSLNSTVGITATSDVCNLDKIEYSINNIKKYGLNVIETNNVRKRINNELVSSEGKTRAEEFLKLFLNDNVQAIISARGGEFLMEMIPYVHEKLNSLCDINNLVWCQGYSDTSLLLFYLTTNYNIATIHAENIGAFAMKNWHESLKNTFDFLFGKNLPFLQKSFEKYQINEIDEINLGYNLSEMVEYKNLRDSDSEYFEGHIIGGCIDTIMSIVGTKYDNTLNYIKQFSEGIIWYLETCELSVAEFYRKLWQIKEAGWFENTNGVLIGRTFVSKDYFGFTYKKCLEKIFIDLDIPVIFDVDIGHVAPQLTIINGSFAKIEYFRGSAKITQILI